jgi:hypothetical protein
VTPRKLRAVQEGEAAKPARKAPAKRAPRTMAHAAKLSRKTMLETLRDRIAASMDDPRAHPRDQLAAAKQLLDVQNLIDQLSAKGRPVAAEPSAIANTPNAAWDEDAI